MIWFCLSAYQNYIEAPIHAILQWKLAKEEFQLFYGPAAGFVAGSLRFTGKRQHQTGARDYESPAATNELVV